MYRALSQIKPNEVYNLAGQSSVGLSFDQPVETIESINIGTINILEAIRFIGTPIRFYNASSSESFGDTDGAAADEKPLFALEALMQLPRHSRIGSWQTTEKLMIFMPAMEYCSTMSPH